MLSLIHIFADGNNVYKSEDGVLLDKSGRTLLLYPAAKKEASYTTPDSVQIVSAYAFANTRCV